jgi:Fe-S cluster assembly protein SufD
MSQAAVLTTLTTGFAEQNFRALLEKRSEVDWVRALRRQALEVFASKPMPALNHEEWRRTDIRALKLDAFVPAGLDESSESVAASESFTAHLSRGQFAGSMLQVDGRHVSVELAGELARKGIIFCSMDDAVRRYRELVEPHFMTRGVDPSYDKFSALHAAFWVGGAFLYVPRGARIQQPLYFLTGLSPRASSDLSHTLVVLEEGAEATIFQEQTSAPHERSALHVGAIELFVGQGARLSYVNLQNWDNRVWHFAHQRGLVARDGYLQWVVGGLGSRLAKVNQEVVLEGPGSEAQVNGVMFTTGRQHLSYHTRQIHQADHARSDLLYRGALKDHSRIVWRGMIAVEPGAQKTDAYQRDDNLILSPSARADSIPGLEIKADDVRCTHGATAGRVDEEQVFYAMCRGLTRMEAMHMIVEGFFGTVLDRIPIESVREALQLAVAEKLGW